MEREVSYFRGKHNYDRDGLQNYLVYKGLFSYFETSTGSNINKWKSSGVYDKDDSSLEAVNSGKGKAPRLTTASQNGKLNVRSDKSMLKQSKVIYNHSGVINVYITFRLRANTNPPDFGLENCLFGAVKIQKDATNSSTRNILDML